MEDEETGVNYDATGFKNKSIDKINGQVQAMSGVTGTAPTNTTSMHNSDAKFYRGISKFTDSRAFCWTMVEDRGMKLNKL